MSAALHSLPPTSTMTPEQALHSALALGLTDVLIVGYDSDGDLAVRSSRMKCQDALWLMEKLRAYVLSGGDAR